MGKFVDRTGRRYGRLVVLRLDESSTAAKGGRLRWVCVCDCGATATVTGHCLQRGETQSCGCLKKERLGDGARTHGMTRTPAYNSWRAMRARCEDTRNEKFPEYGGRGIRACKRWKKFENFLADMGARPPNHTLDRIDVNGDYKPSNCRWATPAEQAANRRRTVSWGGVATIKEIARTRGIPRTSLNKAFLRLRDMDAAITYCEARLKA